MSYQFLSFRPIWKLSLHKNLAEWSITYALCALVSPVLPQLFQWWPKFTGIYDYILGLKIGSQYVESEKCRRIRSQQIMTNNNDEPVVINNQVGKIEETNAAFELNEKM